MDFSLRARRIRSLLSKYFHEYKYLHLIVAFYIAVFSIIALSRHYSFGSSAWDLGIFNQAFYTTIKHGRFFYYTAELYANPGGTIFGVHFSPILFLVVPFYAILPRPETLIIVQTAVLASGAYPTFLLSNHVLKNKSLSLFFSLMYLMYPHLHSVNLFDFHSEAFFVPFALLSIYFFVTEKWSRYFLFMALSFFSKEFASIQFLILALILLWSKRKAFVQSLMRKKLDDKKIQALLITVAAAIVWVIVAKASIFFFNPYPNPGFTQGEPWRILGGNPLDFSILGSIHQLDFLRALKFQWEEKLFYLFTALGPMLFLPAMKLSFFLPTSLWFLLAFFSNYPPYYQLGYQYSAYIIPFSIVASIYGLNNIRSKLRISEGMLLALMKRFVFVSMLCALALSLMRLPLTDPNLLGVSVHDRKIYDTLEFLPNEASVLTQYDIFPHLSSSPDSYVVPPPFGAFKIDYYYSYVQSLFDKNIDYVVIDINPDIRTSGLDITYLMVFKEIEKRGDYGLYASIDGVLMYQLGYEGETIFEPFTMIQEYYDAALTEDGTIFEHPLPEGVYKGTFRIITDKEVEDLLFRIEVRQNMNVIESKDVYSNDGNTYQDILFNFAVLDQTKKVEFKIVALSPFTSVYIESLEIRQISYSSS